MDGKVVSTLDLMASQPLFSVPLQPVSAACIRGDLNILELLCEAGMDLNHPNKYGATPLHVAVRRGFVEVRSFSPGYDTLLTSLPRASRSFLNTEPTFTHKTMPGRMSLTRLLAGITT